MRRALGVLWLAPLIYVSFAALEQGTSEHRKFARELVQRRLGQTSATDVHYQKQKPASTIQSIRYLPGKVIVKLKSTTSAANSKLNTQLFSSISSLNSRMKNLGIDKIDRVFPMENPQPHHTSTDLSTIYELSFDSSRDPWEVATTLASDANVQYAEPHFVYDLAFTPNDSLFNMQYHLPLIGAEEAWDITQGSTDVVIAVVDAGVDWYHPDLVDNIWQNSGEDADGDGHTIEFDGSKWTLDQGDLNGIDNDDFDNNPTTLVDDLVGWDVADDDYDPVNSINHGTQVAGLASGTTNNRIGVAGIGFRCRIMPVKVSSDGQEFVDFGFEGVKYAVDAGADIINMSWGGGGTSSFGLDVIKYAHEQDVVLVAAAGNLNEETQFFPAAYSHVLSVAATGDYYDIKASFSNYGYWVDLSAPGLWVLSTDRYETYRQANGTSFASPIVAGVAALVRSHHPGWSADQISEQVRVSSDNIERNNSGMHREKLGFGRVNAYQALTKASPSIRISDVSVSDRTGNGNNIIEQGERIELTIGVINHLQGAENVTLVIETQNTNIRFLNNTITVGNLATGQSFINTANPFTFAVADTTPHGTTVEFVVRMSANNGSYQDHEPIYLTVAPLHGDHDIGNVRLTLTSFGAMGFYDYANTGLSIGNGFEFPKGAGSTLFHGTFMVGTDQTHVSDAAYGDSRHTKYDWIPDNNIYLTIQNETDQDQKGFARYNDSGADNPIGVTVSQRSRAYKSPPYDDFVILEYTLENTRESPITGLYAALFMDWDILQSATNEVAYDSASGLGYMYDKRSIYCGVALLSPTTPASHRAIKNADYVYSGFEDATKFDFMTKGFRISESDAPNDWSHMLSAGPFKLGLHEALTVAFAVLGGENLADLQNNALAARQIYFSSDPTSVQMNASIPQDYALHQNFPNPFNPTTSITYELPEVAHVLVLIHNLLGQKLNTLQDGFQELGKYSVVWDGKNGHGEPMSSGIYLCRILAKNKEGAYKLDQTRKMLLVR